MTGLRLEHEGVERSGAPVTLLVDGRPLPAFEGETIAAALAAAGIARLRTARNGDPRGLFCGMGVCFECLVAVDGRPSQRACMTMVRAGMRVGLAGDATGQATPGLSPVSSPDEIRSVDVVIVGAGPAGLAAAKTLASSGVIPIVLDERASPGGQYYKPLAASHRFRGGRATDSQFAAGLKLSQEVKDLGVEILSAATVWDARIADDDAIDLAYERNGRAFRVRARRLLVATGAYERPWPVPGWTLPGAMTTGAAQTLARAYRVAPGTRVLITGNGPLNLQLAAELVAGGCQVVAVAETAAHPARGGLANLARMVLSRPDLVADGIRYRAALRAAGVQVLHRHALIAVEGTDRVEAAMLGQFTADGGLIVGSERRFEVDAVTMGYGFLPSSELTRLLGCEHDVSGGGLVARRDYKGRTSLPGVFVAGDCGGIGGAAIARAQGELAAAAICEDLGRAESKVAQVARARLAREGRFQKALWALFSAPSISAPLIHPHTIVCRCENVRFGAISDRDAGDVGQLKRVTRCGMGCCQGRYCLTVLGARASAIQNPVAVQMPLKPVGIEAIATIASAVPALGATLSEPQSPRRPAIDVEVEQCDILVIGGGIAGICTAYELARAGEDVLLLERNAAPGAEASGANAGSLHVQSLAYAFENFETAAARSALAALKMQRDSAHLWLAMVSALDVNLEIKMTGGLCVADDEASVVKLRRKVELERASGIDVHLITGDEARRLEPQLSPNVIAASYVPDEGKLNSLHATSAVARVAAAAGARIRFRSEVVVLDRLAERFEVSTPDRRYRARRVLIAAGPGSATIARLLDSTLAVQATPLQMIVTEPLAPTVEMLVAHVARRLTVKQAQSGNVIIGGGWRAASDPTGRLRPTVEGFASNLRIAAETIPVLAGVHVIRSWVAVNGTPAGGPLIGPLPGVPDCFVAVALNGLTLGPVMGRICADLLRGREPEWDITPFDPANR